MKSNNQLPPGMLVPATLRADQVPISEMGASLYKDYFCRVAGEAPYLEFEYDFVADRWLSMGLAVQPYHYKTYKGEPFDRKAQIEWLRQLPDERAYLWAKTGRDINIVRECIKEPVWAFRWALDIGDREIMRERMTEPWWMREWALTFNDDELMRMYSAITQNSEDSSHE